MRIRIVDKKNDWEFGNGITDYTQNSSAVILNIKLKLQEWFNDCFFDLNAGIDWKTRLGSYKQKELLDMDIQKIIRSVNGVLGIATFTSRIINRQYICQFSVYQQYSTDIPVIEFKYEV